MSDHQAPPSSGTVALLAHFPDLCAHLPHLALADLPTPVHPLDHLGVKQLWIKRDDATAARYGGNKVRKLEWILAHARAHGYRRIVSFGAIGTNHGVATSVYSRLQGLDCSLILFDQPVTDTVKQNLAIMHAQGAELIHAPRLAQTIAHFYGWQRLRYPKAYFLFAGGSNIQGTLGFVSAAFELADQISAGLLPEPELLVCPIGSSATVAGLALGCAWAGLATQVCGVRVAPSHFGPIPTCTPATIGDLMKRTAAYLQKRSPQIPKTPIPPPIVLENYYGQGYGVALEKGKAAAQLLQEKEGIKVEQTYSAKALAAALDLASRREGPVLYWHTFNSQATAPLMAPPPERPLPESLQRLVFGQEDS